MHLNPFEIKSYVNQVIRKYNLDYPLDIQSFASTLGFEIKYVDTGDCDALTVMANGQKLILLNQKIHFEPRINFTLAHELGHYFIPTHLEPLYACNINELVSNWTLDTSSGVEREADIFASQLLLPDKFIDKSIISSMNDIISVARTYGTSIPTTAIRMMESSYDIVAFVCCKGKKISWVSTSRGFKENLTLRNLVRLPLPELSLVNTCIENNIGTYAGKIQAYAWLEDIDDHSSYIEEEVIFYPTFETAYVLIKADNLLNEY